MTIVRIVTSGKNSIYPPDQPGKRHDAASGEAAAILLYNEQNTLRLCNLTLNQMISWHGQIRDMYTLCLKSVAVLEYKLNTHRLLYSYNRLNFL
jgi:hypothetical protein